MVWTGTSHGKEGKAAAGMDVGEGVVEEREGG